MTHDPTSATSEADAPPSRGRGRPVGDRDAKRATLLKAAIAVIAKEGYAGASLRGVAQHAGCQLGGVTYYFTSKDEMVTAVAEQLFDVFDTLLEGQEGVDIRAMFERWFGPTEGYDREAWQALFQLLAHARDEPAFAAVFQRRYGEYRQKLTEILARGQGEGLIRRDLRPDLLSDLLCAIGDGWMIAFPIERDRFDATRIQALLDTVITVITPPK